MRSGTVAAILLFAATGCQALTRDEPQAPERRLQVIDEEAGSYRGVRFGDSPRELQRRLGPRKPAGPNEPVVPVAAGADTKGPTYIGMPDPSRPGRFRAYRYRWSSFSFADGRLFAIEIVEPGAETRRRVAVGDPLSKVSAAYPDAVCGTAGGGEWEEYPACQVEVAPKRGIWFGGNPIRTIALASVEMGDVVPPPEPFTGETFELEDGEFADLPDAKPGDRVVCKIDGKRIEVTVPEPNTGISRDPMRVSTSADGSVRAECGGIHAETAPPGSY